MTKKCGLKMNACVDNGGQKTVAVIMPAYNASAYIEDAIRSVMAQTYPHWKLLVMDDKSQDDTCAIVLRLAEEDARIQLIRNEKNLGVAKTRNRALDLCGGCCVAFLDSDDLWHPDKLRLQMQMMETEQADLVYASYGIMDCHGTPCKQPYLVPAATDFEQLLRENVIGCSAVLLSERLAGSYRFVSGFHHEDYCLWLSILRDGYRAVGCRQVLMTWRLACGSRSFDKRNGARSRWRIYRRHLGLPFMKSALCFASYAWKGVKKYANNRKD